VTALHARAPAKINLCLLVGPVRAGDGRHELVSVMDTVSLADDLVLEPADGGADEVVCAGVEGPNLVAAAIEAFRARIGWDGAPVRITVTKRIPVAGGMAGGSADAAAALVALDRLWGLETSDDDLLSLAAELGSDVPFALVGGTALGTGRGELVEPVRDPATWWWVVVPSEEGLSTPSVYRRFDELNPDAPAEPEDERALLLALATGDPVLLAGALHNDLESAALDLRPDLADLLELGERSGALRGLVSGSGPTCLFLTEDADSAREVAARLSESHGVVLVTNGPVAGAHVVTYA